jgi:hypothetical protein
MLELLFDVFVGYFDGFSGCRWSKSHVVAFLQFTSLLQPAGSAKLYFVFAHRAFTAVIAQAGLALSASHHAFVFHSSTFATFPSAFGYCN